MKNKKLFLITAFFVLALLVSIILVLQNQDVRSRAFTGFSINQSNIPQSVKDDPSPLDSLIADPESNQYWFHELSRSYPNATTQNIQQEGTEISGVASLAYNDKIDKTLIFVRLDNVPFFKLTPMNLWFQNTDTGSYQRAAVAEFSVENGKPVAYIVYAADGDLRTIFQKAYISYESLSASEPLLPIIELDL